MLWDSIYALRALVDALAPLLGAEVEAGNKAVSEQWAKDASQERIKAWTEKGKEINDEVTRVMQETTSFEYGRLMRKVRWESVVKKREGCIDVFWFLGYSALVYADKIPLTNLRLLDLSSVYSKATRLISILHSAPCAASSPLWSKVSKTMNRLKTSPPHLSINYWVCRLIPIQMTLKRHKTSSSGLKLTLRELRARRRNGVRWWRIQISTRHVRRKWKASIPDLCLGSGCWKRL